MSWPTAFLGDLSCPLGIGSLVLQLCVVVLCSELVKIIGILWVPEADAAVYVIIFPAFWQGWKKHWRMKRNVTVYSPSSVCMALSHLCPWLCVQTPLQFSPVHLSAAGPFHCTQQLEGRWGTSCLTWNTGWIFYSLLTCRQPENLVDCLVRCLCLSSGQPCCQSLFLMLAVYLSFCWKSTTCIAVFAGIKKLRFKPAFNPYTEPSMEIFSYHEGKWIMRHGVIHMYLESNSMF